MRILITSIMDVNKTAPNRLHHFVRHFSQSHSVTILSTNQWWKAEQADLHLYAKDFVDMLQNVEVRYFTERRLGPIWQEVSSVVSRNKVLNGINYGDFAVHLNYSALISGYVVAKGLKGAGIGTIYDIADDLPQMVRTSPEVPVLFRAPGKLISEVMVRKNIELAQKVTFTVNGLINSYSLPQNKAKSIPNGVNTELFRAYPSQRQRKELGLNHSFVVGYVGSLREWVDLSQVFAVVKRLKESQPDMKVLIVGEEGRFEDSRDLAEEYGISDCVVFTGTVPYSQVPHYISCMDICLIPFKTNAVSQNALPLKLFEYMACQRPVISTRLRGVIEAVGDKVLYASNIEELKTHIMALYQSERRQREMGLTGRRLVEENYSWSRICSNMEEVLLEVASMKGKV